MKTIEVKLYEFNELSEEAKKNAISQARESRWEYDWVGEALSSLDCFLNELGTHIINYSIDWENPSRSYVKVYDAESIDTEFTFDSDDYSLTGYCMDYPLIKTWNETRDVHQAIEAWLMDCAKDYEYQISDGGIAEFIQMNGYDFTEDGKLY